jgi:hypothetical protein
MNSWDWAQAAIFTLFVAMMLDHVLHAGSALWLLAVLAMVATVFVYVHHQWVAGCGREAVQLLIVLGAIFVVWSVRAMHDGGVFSPRGLARGVVVGGGRWLPTDVRVHSPEGDQRFDEAIDGWVVRIDNDFCTVPSIYFPSMAPTPGSIPPAPVRLGQQVQVECTRVFAGIWGVAWDWSCSRICDDMQARTNE